MSPRAPLSFFSPVFALFVCISSIASAVNASPLDDYFRNFSGVRKLEQAVSAYEICTDLMDNWRSPAYRTTIESVGQMWTSQPEPSYYLLNTCQQTWITRYLQPLKKLETKDAQTHSRFAFLLSAVDFIHLPKYLWQEVELFAQLPLRGSSNIPPAPYEYLTRMASTERALDEAIHTEMRQQFTLLAGTGMTWAGFKVGKTIVKNFTNGATRATRVSKSLLIAAIIGLAADQIVDESYWQARQKALWDEIGQLTDKLERFNQGGQAPLPVLLDEFYKATEHLGYFYSYSLYLDESGFAANGATANTKCLPEIKDHFSAADIGSSIATGTAVSDQKLVNSFLQRSVCADGAALWLAASLFLTRTFPNDRQAAYVADRLLNRSKRALMSYEETKAYEATLPVCVPNIKPGASLRMECHDPVTGASET